MTWTRSATSVVLTVTSVVLTVLTGVVVNVFTDIWGWALLSALLVLATCTAIVKVVRRRMDALNLRPRPATTPAQEPAPSRPGPPGSTSMTISGSTISGMVAGRDINKSTRIGTGGLAAILTVALLVAGGTSALGRTDAALPKGDRAQALRRPAGPAATTAGSPELGPTNPSPGTPTASTPAAEPSAFADIITVQAGTDLDPPKTTKKVVDISYDDEVGLSLLNGTKVAPIPGSGRPSLEACGSASGYSGSVVPTPIPAGYSRCLQTSDGNYGR